MATTYGPYSGNNVTNTADGATLTWYAKLTYTITDYPTYVAVSATGALHLNGGSSTAMMIRKDRITAATLNIGGSAVKTYSGPSSDTIFKAGDKTLVSYSATYQKTTAVQTKACSFSIKIHKYSSWSGTSSVTASTPITIPALADYAVSYNANGGSGSIQTVTKYYNIPITLSDGAGMSRTYHSLTGWNTAADGNGTAYALGATFSENADTPLYAQWHLDYIPPVLTDTEIYRVASAGSTTETDSGERIHVGFGYTGGSLDGGTTHIKPTVKVEIDGTTVYNTQQSSATDAFSTDYGTYSKDTSHTVVVTVYDSNSEGVSFGAQIATATYPLDILVDSNDDVCVGIMHTAVGGQTITTDELTVDGEISADNMLIDLSDYQVSGSTDKAIYDAVTTLGWSQEVIV